MQRGNRREQREEEEKRDEVKEPRPGEAFEGRMMQL